MVVALAVATACSASKSSGDGPPTSPSPLLTLKLRASDVLSGAAIVGATVAGSGVNTATTDAGGSLNLTTSSASTFAIDVTTAAYITRNTLLKVPGADVTVSLIKNDFDLTAFNQMFRNVASDDGFAEGPLRRWTSQPSLSVVSRVVQYTAAGTT
jgi:hypothetical protein